MDLDQLLSKLGSFGKYQKFIFFSVCLTQVMVAFNFMGIIFLAGVPDHWCAVPQLENLSLAETIHKNLTLPLEFRNGEKQYSRCSMYDVDYSGWSQADVLTYISSRNTSGIATKHCSNGWVYDRSMYTNTVVMEWDMVCDRSWMVSASTSVFMAGLMVGVFVFGAISDWIGRRKTLLITVFLGSIFTVSCAFSTNLYVFCGIRFCIAFCTMAAYTTAFVIGMELVGPSQRVLAAVLMSVFWTSGYLIVAGIAYGIRDWFRLQLVLSTSAFVCYSFYFIIPESIRWLYANDRQADGEKIIRKIAKVNGAELPEKLFIKTETEKGRSVLDLFKTPRLRLRTFNLFFIWFVCSLVYFGLSMNTSNLGGDPYVNFAISAAVELPSYMFCYISMSHIGRRISLCFSLCLGGTSLILTSTVPSHLNVISIALAMTGKLFASGSFMIIYIFTAELLPTVMRNVGMGACSSCARIGAVVAPFIAQLGETHRIIPLVIFGVLAVCAGLTTLLLPETRGKTLPQTVHDAETFGTHQPKLDFEEVKSDADMTQTKPLYVK